jgi:hypothetical protein
MDSPRSHTPKALGSGAACRLDKELKQIRPRKLSFLAKPASAAGWFFMMLLRLETVMDI